MEILPSQACQKTFAEGTNDFRSPLHTKNIKDFKGGIFYDFRTGTKFTQ